MPWSRGSREHTNVLIQGADSSRIAQVIKMSDNSTTLTDPAGKVTKTELPIRVGMHKSISAILPLIPADSVLQPEAIPTEGRD